MIEFKNISIGYNTSLFKIDHLHLLKGKLVVLIGPNGAGKTTLFNTLLGVQKPMSGTIEVDNVDFTRLDKGMKTKSFGFVPSRFAGVQHLSVRGLVAMGRAPYTNVLNQLNKKDNQIIDEVLELLNIRQLEDKSTTQVSDGERQIAMIGKVLAQSTQAILLDEPTAFLDYTNRKKVLSLLKELSQKEKKLIVVSSHDLELCMSYADEIIAIDANKKKLLKFTVPFEKDAIVDLIFD
jgi:iron complex transport system ATP-binding protein